MTDTSLPGKRANRHPVDRLFDVRQQIKALTEEETDLKAKISVEMGRADSLGGDECIASQKLQERKGGLDEAAMIKAGIDVEAFRKPSATFVVIKVEQREREAA
jgi:hypothetical protein